MKLSEALYIELSEEDQQLKSDLEMLVQRLTVSFDTLSLQATEC